MTRSDTRVGLGALLLASVLLGAAPAAASAPVTAPEFQVKAAFLVNFGSFVTWPETAFVGPRSPLVICVLGESPFGDAFAPLREVRVGGRPVVVQTIGSAAQVAHGCNVVFIAQSERARLADVLRALELKSVLTVSDLDVFAEAGGMIQLFTKGGKIRFEINRAAAERAGLKLDARLLSLAEPAASSGGGESP